MLALRYWWNSTEKMRDHWIAYATHYLLNRQHRPKWTLPAYLSRQRLQNNHSWRAYHQVQKWLGVNKNPCDWGWATSEQGLMPITMTAKPAPQSLLKMVACKCKKGCVGSCSCRKAGIKCSILCSFCQGRSCSNVVPVVLDEEDDHLDDPLCDDLSPPLESFIHAPSPVSINPNWIRPGPSNTKRTRLLWHL